MTIYQSARRHIPEDFNIQLVRSPEQKTRSLLSYCAYSKSNIAYILLLVLIQSIH